MASTGQSEAVSRIDDGAAVAQPERMTLVERLVSTIPLPYTVACALVAVLIGSPGAVLARYLDSGDWEQSVRGFFRALDYMSLGQYAAEIVLWTVLLFYALWATRYMRRKVAAAEAALEPLLPEGRRTYEQAFGRIVHLGPSLAVSAVLMALFASFIVLSVNGASRPFEIADYAIAMPLTYLIYGTAIWVYLASLLGLRALGQRPLRLKPFYEDGMLGTRPMGELSLSISFAFFGFLACLVAIMLVGPVVPQLIVLLVALTALGTVMFFVPLYGVHQLMKKEKDGQQMMLRQRIMRLLQWPGGAANPEPAGADLPAVLAELKDLFALEAADRKLIEIPVWPFDTDILRALAVIVIPILIAVLTQFVMNALRL